jgi:hypothetical protein
MEKTIPGNPEDLEIPLIKGRGRRVMRQEIKVKPNTPLGLDQVNVLLLILLYQPKAQRMFVI